MFWCKDCVHDGCCDDLPYCGGMYFQSRFIECERCGEEFDPELSKHGGEDSLCDGCFEDRAEEEAEELAKDGAEEESK